MICMRISTLQKRTESLSRNHSWSACQFFFFDSPLPRFRHFSSLRATFCALTFLLMMKRLFSTILETNKRKRKTGIRSLDPWNGNLLCWPLDHAAPLFGDDITFSNSGNGLLCLFQFFQTVILLELIIYVTESWGVWAGPFSCLDLPSIFFGKGWLQIITFPFIYSLVSK